MEVATEVVRRFAAALSARDQAAAAACAVAWRPDRDGAARMYNQLLGAPIKLEPIDEPRAGVNGRVAQGVGIVHEGKVVEKQMLLLEGEPLRIAGVAASAPHAARYLEGTVPAVIHWADMPADAGARAAAELLVASFAPGIQVVETSTPEALAYVVNAVANGATLEIVDARGLPELGRSAVETRLVAAGKEPETVVLYRDTDWRGWTPYFSAPQLVAL